MLSQHLLIAVSIVTSDSDSERDVIEEFAAKAILPPSLQDESFETELKFVSQIHSPSPNTTWKKCTDKGGKNDPTEMKLDFSTEFIRFLDWLQFVIREARKKSNAYLLTALVGHFALWKDFYFLHHYIENYVPQHVQEMVALWCQFADSGELFCKLKRMNLMERTEKTSLNEIHKSFLGEDLKVTCALDAVEALVKILSLPSMQSHLQHMDLLTYSALKIQYEKEKWIHEYLADFMDNLGPDLVHVDLLQKLAYRKLTLQNVRTIYQSSRNSVNFRTKMKSKLELDISPQEATELYIACKQRSKFCDCCYFSFKKMASKHNRTNVI